MLLLSTSLSPISHVCLVWNFSFQFFIRNIKINTYCKSVDFNKICLPLLVHFTIFECIFLLEVYPWVILSKIKWAVSFQDHPMSEKCLLFHREPLQDLNSQIRLNPPNLSPAVKFTVFTMDCQRFWKNIFFMLLSYIWDMLTRYINLGWKSFPWSWHIISLFSSFIHVVKSDVFMSPL